MSRDPVLDLLLRLIAIDSVNPSLVPGGAGEGEMAGALAEEMAHAGLAVEVTEVAPGRPNVVGVLENRRPGPALLFCGHLDTVGVAGMAAPFTPAVRDGRLYGRGAQDMKAGVAAMVDAACSLARTGGLAAGRLIVAGVADEEHASLGAEALVKTVRADAAVVTEPTDLRLGVAHRGFEWVEVETAGVAAHGSRPAEGRDAILRMGRVLGRLEALDRALQARQPHPLLGTASLHASLIEGGRELSSYPDRCGLQLERRTLPGEPPTAALAEVEEILADLRREDPEFRAEARPRFRRQPLEIDPAQPLARALGEVIARLGRPAEPCGLSFWTDAALLAGAGIPTVVFGPGGEGLHGLVEYVRLDEVVACRDALVALARAFCT
jgi:acetylornithine deacetylase